MSRSAFLVSLVIHAGVLALAGWASLSANSHAGLGKSETSVFFSTGTVEGLVAEDAASDSAPPAEFVETFAPPPVAQPAITVPVEPMAPPPTEPTPPPISTTATLPKEIPSLMPIQKAKSAATRSNSPTGKSRSTSSSRSATSGPGEGTGEGAGTAGAGGGGGPGYVPPRFLMRYKPPYPDEARAQRLTGVVMLLVSVDTSGRVTGARLSQTCGHPVLDKAALSAVRSWRFIPARQLDQIVAATVEVPIRFHFSGLKRGDATKGGLPQRRRMEWSDIPCAAARECGAERRRGANFGEVRRGKRI